MIFNSLNFLIFFPIVIIIYYLIPYRFRWGFLLLASYFFYINLNPFYVLLLAGVTLTTYIFTLIIDQAKTDQKKKILLIINIIVTLLPLFFFKYYTFINDGIISMLQHSGLRWPLPEIKLLLPVGISFYTFMAIGYSIDVYNEDVKAERNIGLIALFLSFFPLVLSGPIERGTNMIPQFKDKQTFNYDKVVYGLKLILWGYFMKLVIADRVSIYTNAVFENAVHHSGPTLLLSSLLYPIQVYCDLGGYSLIAIGCAAVMGFNVMPNFNRPFFATSMSVFWRRWHMSLISWMTDYIYTPLSLTLRKFRIWGIIIALMLTFIISGIWHGAAMTFIIWGAIQGIILSIEALTNKKKDSFEKRYNLKKNKGYILITSTFTYLLFSFSLLFGGCVDSVSQSFYVIKTIFGNFGPVYVDGLTLLFSFIGILILFVSEFRDEYFHDKYLLFNNRNMMIRWSAYVITLVMVLMNGVFTGNQFIYELF